ncbi:MAG: hypothetical protein N2D54_09495 [Chloroflexota bacterium]
MWIRKLMIMLVVFMFTFSACALSLDNPDPTPGPATSVALTGAALGNGSDDQQATSIAATVAAINAASGAGNQGAQPSATTPPQDDASGTGDSTAPSVSDVRSDLDVVYYPDTTCGPKTVTIFANVSDDSGSLASVQVDYRFFDYTSEIGGTQWFSMEMTGENGAYSALIDIVEHASAELVGYDGTLEYTVTAVDAAGNSSTSPESTVLGVTVIKCGEALSGPIIMSLPIVEPYAVYYGQCKKDEPTWLNIQSKIEPVDNVKKAIVKYWFQTQSSTWQISTMFIISVGDQVTDIDIGSIAKKYVSGDGELTFQIEVENTFGEIILGQPYTIEVIKCGYVYTP